MGKFLNCLKETYRTLTNGEGRSCFSKVAILVAFMICIARFVHDFIKRFTKRENQSLRMKCSNCGHWNRVSVNKVFIEQNSPESEYALRNGYAFLDVISLVFCLLYFSKESSSKII